MRKYDATMQFLSHFDIDVFFMHHKTFLKNVLEFLFMPKSITVRPQSTITLEKYDWLY